MNIVIYTTTYCSYCHKAMALLDSKELKYTNIDVTNDPAKTKTLIQVTQCQTVPQIFIDGHFIGGYSDLIQELNKLGY